VSDRVNLMSRVKLLADQIHF